MLGILKKCAKNTLCIVVEKCINSANKGHLMQLAKPCTN